jgi:methionyl-tRNA synthetase
MSKQFYITTPIYYVNAKPHIGHAYTTLGADVISRWHKLQGEDAYFLTGTDEHGAKVAEAADVAKKEPQVFTDEIAETFESAWKNLNIQNTDFIRTTEERHKKGVAKFLEELKDKGVLYEGEYTGLYCTGCESFITEKELIDGKCPHHNKVPEKVTEKNWFFKLSDYLEEIKKKVETDEIKIQPDFAKKEVLGLLKQGLEDFSVTRENVDWGIKLPWDDNQTIYVWVEALQNYITASDYNGEKAPWPADVHLIGKDIIKFHCVYWPAMLLAAGLDLPKELFVHGFFTIDGEKMSKSLGNVIDPNDLVKDYGVDGARYLILSQFPFGQDGDVKAEKFTEQYNSALANGIGNVVFRVSNLLEKDSIKIDIKQGSDKDLKDRVSKAFEKHALHEVLNILWSELTVVDETLEKEKPWELDDVEEKKKILEPLAQKILNVADLLQPFLPESSKQIIEQFGSKSIKKGKPLFPRK